MTKIAKDYGKSAKWMNAKLHDYGVQFKQGDQWFLYQDYAKLGYTQSTTHVIDDEHSRMMTKWTQKGRLFIYETLKDGITAVRAALKELEACGYMKIGRERDKAGRLRGAVYIQRRKRGTIKSSLRSSERIVTILSRRRGRWFLNSWQTFTISTGRSGA